MVERSVIDWLLEEEEPSIRYRTLTELLGRGESDRDVRAARRAIGHHGWGADILATRLPGAGWDDQGSPYRPKYLSTNWKMLVLADLKLTRRDPAIREACEYWMRAMATREGGVGGNSKGTAHYCVAANMARALTQMGYGTDPRIRNTLDWLVSIADPKGGWSCFGRGRNLDSWEALSAFAVYPRSRWTPAMEKCVARAAEFYLQRELCEQGAVYAPWFRSHYPVHYYYDIFVGLDFMTALGYGADPRLARALSTLEALRRPDGRWNLDALHPDVEGGVAAWFLAHPKDRPTPWGIERPGQPSKMVTLTALRILGRVERARASNPGGPSSTKRRSASRPRRSSQAG